MKKAPEGAFSKTTMTQMPVPRRGDVAKRSASEPWRGTGICVCRRHLTPH